MITVNAGFSRKVGKKREWKNVQGIRLPVKWSDDHAEIRAAIYRHAPKGFTLEGYALIKGEK